MDVQAAIKYINECNARGRTATVGCSRTCHCFIHRQKELALTKDDLNFIFPQGQYGHSKGEARLKLLIEQQTTIRHWPRERVLARIEELRALRDERIAARQRYAPSQVADLMHTDRTRRFVASIVHDHVVEEVASVPLPKTMQARI